jgi:hypothetical protein
VETGNLQEIDDAILNPNFGLAVVAGEGNVIAFARVR